MLEGNGLSKTSGTVVTFAKNVSAAKVHGGACLRALVLNIYAF